MMKMRKKKKLLYDITKGLNKDDLKDDGNICMEEREMMGRLDKDTIKIDSDSNKNDQPNNNNRKVSNIVDVSDNRQANLEDDYND